MQMTSTAFPDGELIPKRYTCDGQDISPPLAWRGVPEKARSLVLICDDPDAPMGTWVHWVLYDLPADSAGLPEAVPAEKTLKSGARHGKNSWGRVGYGGPCPPGGTHRYYFKLYALDRPLKLSPGKKKAEVIKAMEGRILAEAKLMGKYRRR